MLLPRCLFLGITVVLPWGGNAYAGPADPPTPQLCATVDACTKLIDTLKDPTKLANALTDRCQALFVASAMRKSTEDCDRAIAIDPGLAAAYDIRSQIRRLAFLSARDPAERQQAAKEAKADLDKLVELAPDQARPYLLRGNYFLFTEQDALALPDLDKAASLSPKEPLVYLLRSRAHKTLGNDDLALKDADTFLAIAPPRADILTMMAEIHLDRNELKQALELTDQAVAALASGESGWDRNRALKLRGRTYLAMGEKAKAKKDFVAALASWPMDNDVRQTLEGLLGKRIPLETDCNGWALAGSRQDALNAIETCSEVLDVFESGSAREQRALLYLGTKQYDLAAADYSKLIESDPKYLGYYNHRADVYYAAGKLDLALADLNRFLEGGPKTRIPGDLDLLRRAQIEIALGKDDDALRDVSDVLANPRGNPRALTLRAWIKARRGQFTEAKEDIDAALAINARLYEGQIAKVQNALVLRSREEADAAFADVFRNN